jgi:hypothetical protein
VLVYACNPSTPKAEVGGTEVEGFLGYTVRPCLKKEETKANKKVKHKVSFWKLKFYCFFCTERKSTSPP